MSSPPSVRHVYYIFKLPFDIESLDFFSRLFSPVSQRPAKWRRGLIAKQIKLNLKMNKNCVLATCKWILSSSKPMKTFFFLSSNIRMENRHWYTSTLRWAPFLRISAQRTEGKGMKTIMNSMFLKKCQSNMQIKPLFQSFTKGNCNNVTPYK